MIAATKNQAETRWFTFGVSAVVPEDPLEVGETRGIRQSGIDHSVGGYHMKGDNDDVAIRW